MTKFSIFLVFFLSVFYLSCTKDKEDNNNVESLDLTLETVSGRWQYNDKCLELNENGSYKMDIEASTGLSKEGTWKIIKDSLAVIDQPKPIEFIPLNNQLPQKIIHISLLTETTMRLSLWVTQYNDIGSQIYEVIEYRDYIRK